MASLPLVSAEFARLAQGALHALLRSPEERETVVRHAKHRGHSIVTVEDPLSLNRCAPSARAWIAGGTSYGRSAELVQALRGQGVTAPIIAVVAHAGEVVVTRRAGASDVVLRPIHAEELFARLDVLLGARTSAEEGERVTIGFTPDGEVQCGTRRARLRRAELAILRYITVNRPRVITAPELLSAVLRTIGDGGSVRTHVWEIRRKLRAAGFPEVVSTIRGAGYRAIAATHPPAQDGFAAASSG